MKQRKEKTENKEDGIVFSLSGEDS